MITISSIRFNQASTGKFKSELTLAINGNISYPKIANLGQVLDMVKTAGGEIKGSRRTLKLKDPSKIQANGGNVLLDVVDYYTTPVKLELDLLGEYVEVKRVLGIAGTTEDEDTAIAKLVANIIPTQAPAGTPKSAPAGTDVELPA